MGEVYIKKVLNIFKKDKKSLAGLHVHEFDPNIFWKKVLVYSASTLLLGSILIIYFLYVGGSISSTEKIDDVSLSSVFNPEKSIKYANERKAFISSPNIYVADPSI